METSAKFLRHEPCPSCGSKDNLARYDDMHAYCFPCNYYEHSENKTPTIQNSNMNELTEQEYKPIISRKIKIDTGSIVSAKKVQYSKYFLNRAVYNLHLKGTIRFYTRGIDAVELIDKDGLVYLIGSQKAEELTRIIQEKLI